MTDWNAQFPEIWEAANLPAGDPARRELESKLPGMDPAQRTHWEEVLRETDLLYGQMSAVIVPAAMEQSLLNIPSDNPPVPRWKEMLTQPVGWKHLAALLVIVAGVLAYVYWPSAGVRPLNTKLADRIATMAVEDHEKPGTMEIVSSDPAKVEAVLAGHKFGFGVMVPQPAGKLELVGGGVVQFDKAPAVFTRWKNGDANFTLYQFNPKQAGLPGNFAETADVPKKLWHDAYHYRVLIRCGTDQQGAWAVVMEQEGTTDPFAACGIGVDVCR